jgi:hypothetical protein
MTRKIKPKLNKKMSPAFINIIVVIVLIILSLTIVANTMSKPVARDEQMYCTGAVLLAQGKMIYRDFSYAAQMPYHPLLCAALFKLFDTTHYLLVCRTVSCVCDILVMLSIVGIYRHIFRSFKTSGTILGLCAVVLYIFNPLVDYANGYAWNHDVVIFCVVLSFWLFISTDFQQKSKYFRVAAEHPCRVDQRKIQKRPAVSVSSGGRLNLARLGNSTSTEGVLFGFSQNTNAVRPVAARDWYGL